MAALVRMPRLGANMEEGTVLRWRKAVGDTVQKGEPLLEVETDKVNAEVEAPRTGVLLSIDVGEGTTVAVGSPIGTIGEAGEAPLAKTPPAQGSSAPPSAPAAAPRVAAEPLAAVPAVAASRPGERIRVSPAARALARELGVDLTRVAGTGPLGRIVRADILGAQAHPPVASAAPLPPLVRTGASRIRYVTAQRMLASLQGSAQLTLHMTADVTRADALRRELGAALGAGGPPVTVTAVVMKAVAQALTETPAMRQAWDESGLHPVQGIHLGMAVAIDEGLVVPVMRDVDGATLLAVSRWIHEVAQRARQGKLSLDELQGATFSVTNLGASGVEYFTPILNPPEPGILGLGRSERRAVVVQEEILVRLVLPLSLTWDHRVIDGAPAAAFCARIKELLESPLRLFAGT